LDALAAIRDEIAEGRAAASAYVSFVDDGPRDASRSNRASEDAAHVARDDAADARPEDAAWRDAVVARLARVGALADGMRAALASGGTG
ncbi:hypothetical protein, partial [Pseudomonas protegens]